MTPTKHGALGTTISYLSSLEGGTKVEGTVWSNGPITNSVWVTTSQDFSTMTAVKLKTKTKPAYALDVSPSFEKWEEENQPPEKPEIPLPWRNMDTEELTRSSIFVNLSSARDDAREMAFKLQNWVISHEITGDEEAEFFAESDKYLLAAEHLEQMAYASLKHGDFFTVNYYGHYLTDYERLGLTRL